MQTTKRNIREYLQNLHRAILFWTLAMILFSIFRYYAIEDELGFSIEKKYLEFYSLKNNIISFGFGGLLAGILYATIDFLVDKFITKKIALGFSILLKTLFIYISLVIISDIVLRLSVQINNIPYIIKSGWWFHDKSFHAILLYITICIFIYATITIVSEKFGKKIFYKMLIGRYKKPKETKQIFMFLDLKSSTSIAEKLGHFKYSKLIQDFFYDLNEITELYDSKVYQYIGDEAVLTWSYKKGISKNNCVQLFFAFQNKIKSKSAYYLKKYGTVPEFKAGAHGGQLMIAEVGIVKKRTCFSWGCN